MARDPSPPSPRRGEAGIRDRVLGRKGCDVAKTKSANSHLKPDSHAVFSITQNMDLIALQFLLEVKHIPDQKAPSSPFWSFPRGRGPGPPQAYHLRRAPGGPGPRPLTLASHCLWHGDLQAAREEGGVCSVALAADLPTCMRTGTRHPCWPRVGRPWGFWAPPRGAGARAPHHSPEAHAGV